jgi:hypothetical protein
VLHVDHLYGALASLTEHYRILEIDGVRLHRYETLYFDTTDFALYRQHHAVDDPIRGKDYLVVNNGNITVDAGSDELQADNVEDAAKG